MFFRKNSLFLIIIYLKHQAITCYNSINLTCPETFAAGFDYRCTVDITRDYIDVMVTVEVYQPDSAAIWSRVNYTFPGFYLRNFSLFNQSKIVFIKALPTNYLTIEFSFVSSVRTLGISTVNVYLFNKNDTKTPLATDTKGIQSYEGIKIFQNIFKRNQNFT